MASLSVNLYGHYLRAAPRSLDRLDGVFGCEPSHNQCQLTVGCHLDGSPINPLHIFSGVSAATVHFHNKLGGFHSFSLLLFYAEERYTAQREARRRRSEPLPSRVPKP